MRLYLLPLMLLAPIFSWGHEKETLPEFTNRLSKDNVHVEASNKLDAFPFANTFNLQVLIPVFQSEEASELWFLHGQGHYRASINNQYLEASFGLGAGYRRQLDNSDLQIGGYGLLDMRIGSLNDKYYLFTPGLEVHAPRWRLILNGYLPLGKRSKDLDKKWGHEFGIETYHSFTEHDECDRLHQNTEVMPIGVDLNGTFQLSNQLSLSIGGYCVKYAEAFHPGARFGLMFAHTPRSRFELQGTRDSAQGTHLSIQYHTSLGGNTIDIDRRYTAIQRPLVPILTDKTPISDKQKIHPYVVFYSPDGSGSAGTFEQPGGNMLNQAHIEQLPEGTAIYLAPGEYSLETTTNVENKSSFLSNLFGGKSDSSNSSTSTSVNPLVLNHKSLIGRTSDFKAPASASTLHFPIKITGEATSEHPIRIEHIKVSSENHSIKTAISIDQAAYVQIKNFNGNHATDGLILSNSNNISIIDSYFYTVSQGNQTALNISNVTQSEMQGNLFKITQIPVENGYPRNIQLLGIKKTSSDTTEIKNNGFRFITDAPANHSTIQTQDPDGKILSKNNLKQLMDANGNSFRLDN